MPELEDLVATRTGELGAIAAAWLAEGARAVELWSHDGLAARWAPGLEVGSGRAHGRRAGRRERSRFPRAGGTHVPISESGSDLGWVRLVGLSGSSARRRLVADASRIAGWISHERDLEVLTDALIERQDELLGLVGLMQAARVDDASDLPRALAEGAREMLHAVAVALVQQDGSSWDVAASPRSAVREIGSAARDIEDADQLRAALGDEWLVLPSTPEGSGAAWLVVRLAPDQVVSSPLIRLAEAIAELCVTLVGQAQRHAQTLERQRLSRQLEFAGEVQRHLLHRETTRMRGLRVATDYHPADSVGGDLYAVCRSGNDTVIALGDVSGKGAPAALLMAEAKALIESHARRTSTPAELLAQVSTDLSPDLERSHAFLTLVVARFQPGEPAFTIANAGHAPVLLKSTDGVRLLEPLDPPIGVVTGADFAQRQYPFAKADTLLLASDGVTDRERPDGARFGIDRLTSSLEQSDVEPRRLLARLRTAADRFAEGERQQDDETLMAVQATSGAHR